MNNLYEKIIRQVTQKEFVLSNLSQLASVLALFLQTKLITMYFSKADYGSWSILMTYYTMLQMLPFTAVNNALCRYAAEYKDRKGEYVTSIFWGYSVIFGIQIILFGSMCLNNLVPYDFENYWGLFMLYCYTETIKSASFNIYTFFRDRKRVFYCYIADFIFIACGLGGMYVTHLITIQSLLVFISLKNVVLIFFINKNFKIRADKSLFCNIYSKVIFFSLPIIFWNIFAYLQSVINKWLLNSNLSIEAVATYTVAVGVATYIPTFYQAFVSSYFFPIVYARKEKISIKKYFKYVFIFAVPLVVYCFVMQFLGKYIVIIVYDRKYIDIVPYLKYTCFAASIGILADISLFEVLRMGLTKKIIVPKIVPGILMIIIGHFLIPYMGIKGAILNYCIGQISYALLSFVICIFIQSKSKESVGIDNDHC